LFKAKGFWPDTKHQGGAKKATVRDGYLIIFSALFHA